MSLSELTGVTRTIPMKAPGKKRILPLGLFVGGQDEQSWKIRGLEGRENSCRGRGWRASRLLSSDLGQASRAPDPPLSSQEEGAGGSGTLSGVRRLQCLLPSEAG